MKNKCWKICINFLLITGKTGTDKHTSRLINTYRKYTNGRIRQLPHATVDVTSTRKVPKQFHIAENSWERNCREIFWFFSWPRTGMLNTLTCLFLSDADDLAMGEIILPFWLHGQKRLTQRPTKVILTTEKACMLQKMPILTTSSATSPRNNYRLLLNTYRSLFVILLFNSTAVGRGLLFGL